MDSITSELKKVHFFVTAVGVATLFIPKPLKMKNFYDVVILPPPPRKPKGKPTVEKYVQFLETHLLEDLKEKVYCKRQILRLLLNLTPLL